MGLTLWHSTRHQTGTNDSTGSAMSSLKLDLNIKIKQYIPRWVPIPKQSILCPCSFRLRIVSSLMSFEATICNWANQGMLYLKYQKLCILHLSLLGILNWLLRDNALIKQYQFSTVLTNYHRRLSKINLRIHL